VKDNARVFPRSGRNFQHANRSKQEEKRRIYVDWQEGMTKVQCKCYRLAFS